MITLLVYFIVLLSLSVYSYFLVDPNLTLVNHRLWTDWRNFAVNIGYFQRQSAWLIYLVIIILLFLVYFILLRKYQRYNPVRIAFIVGIALLLSYPFLSHDFFNYIFDAKIFTYYGLNPYLHKALDFPNDPWLRFMHWTHRSYPYGPTFILISLLPSFLAAGKFFLNFIFFKMMFIGFYIGGVYFLNKVNKKQALIFATHPLIIIEGLVNSHNDLIAVSIGLIGIYYLINSKNLIARVLFLISGGIKYTTLPLMVMSKNYKQLNNGAMITMMLFIIYLSFFREVQPWYFITLFVILPYFKQLINQLEIFFFGLLVSYYPYIRFGGWDEVWKINLKHQIIIFFIGIN